MHIIKATMDDLPAILQIYAEAREFMRRDGNPNQWKDKYPLVEIVKRDIDLGFSHLCVDNDEILAVFYFCIESDPTYAKIDGAWLNDEPYGVVHRIAVRRDVKGVGTFCLNWCLGLCDNLRIDTHEDNRPMRGLLKKLGFTYCGIIWVLDGTEERLAFQKVLRQESDLPSSS